MAGHRPGQPGGLLAQPGEQDDPRQDVGANRPARPSTAYLDGVRGLAALFVFNHHYFEGFTYYHMHHLGFGQEGKFYSFCTFPFLRVFYSGGAMAVVVFFVLSGYVLSIGPLNKMRNGDFYGSRWSLAGALVRRPIRLYLPPLFITFIVAFLLHVPGPLVLPYFNPPQESLWAEAKNWFNLCWNYFNPGMEHDNDRFLLAYNIAVWTLPIELKGSMWIYAILFASTYLVSKQSDHAQTLRAGIAVAILSIIGIFMLQTNYKWSGAAFTFGVILAFIDTWSLDRRGPLSQIPDRTRHILHHAIFFTGWYLLSQPSGDAIKMSSLTPGWVWLTNLIPAAYPESKYYRYWECWGALFLIYGVLRVKWVQTFFSSRPLRYLGKVSFMLYLVHLPFSRIFADRWHHALGGLDPLPGYERSRETWWADRLWIPDIGPLGLNSRWILSLAGALPPVLVLAEYATRYIDVPSIAFAERFTAAIGLGRDKGKRDLEKSVLPS